MSNIPEIKLAPDVIGQIGPVTVTNAMISTFVVSGLLILFALILRHKLSLKPGRLQMFFEILFNLILDKMVVIFGNEKRARGLFPIIFTIFFFLIFANYFTLLPFVESIVTEDGTHLLVTPTAHYSLTIALAIIMVIGSHLVSIAISPIRWLGSFIKLAPVWSAIKNRSLKELAMSFIDVFLGFMDAVGEIAKLISVSTRLFGNMFAGGVIMAIVSGLSVYTQFVAPLPFAVLGLLTGFVQAFVFATLGMLFFNGLISNVLPPEKSTLTENNQTN